MLPVFLFSAAHPVAGFRRPERKTMIKKLTPTTLLSQPELPRPELPRPGEPLDIRLDLDAGIPRYATAEQIATLTGTDVRWVQRQVRRKIVAPALTAGAHQFDRQGILKLLLLAKLQRIFGITSETPFVLLKFTDGAIRDLLTDPERSTVVMSSYGGVDVVIRLPRLRDLTRTA